MRKIRLIKYVCFFVFLLECSLRLLGMALTVPSEIRNNSSPQSGDFTILTLGESTSSDYFAEDYDESWPRQLQNLLTKNGLKVKVINKAFPGTNTAIILSHVDDYLEKYRPDMVISMMGINDFPSLLYKSDGPLNKIASIFSQMRIIRILDWGRCAFSKILEAHNLFAVEKLAENTEIPEATKKFLEKMTPQLLKNNLKHSLEDFETLKIKSQMDQAICLTELAIALEEKFPKTRGNYGFYILLLKKAYSLSQNYSKLIFYSLYFSQLGGDDSFFKTVALNSMKFNEQLPPLIVHQISIFDWKNKEKNILRKIQILYFLKTINVEIDPQISDATKIHYRKLHLKLKGKNIIHLAMQYPTLSLRSLRAYFVEKNSNDISPEFSNIVFIDNEMNFKRILKSRQYYDIFLDHFKESWGHTTTLGHHLIAKNIFDKIFPLLLRKFQERAITAQLLPTLRTTICNDSQLFGASLATFNAWTGGIPFRHCVSK